MKHLYITLSFMLATMAVTAQDKKTAEADKLYARYEYVDAAKAYLDLKEKTPYVYKMLGDSYYNVFNSKEAVKWYAEAVKTPQDAETYYRYAQMLKAEGRYEEANAQMRQFAKLAPSDQRAIAFMKDPDYLPKLRNQAKMFDIKELDINDDKYGSFGGVLADDNTFYFTSSRNEARRTYGGNDEPYLDIYQATYNADGTFSEPVPVASLNSKWHDGPVAVTADGNTMYFASESFKERKEYQVDLEDYLKISQVWLFYTTKQNGEWSTPEPVPFNDKRWSTGNPSVSADGKTLYFASDREGSLGDTDIWKVEVRGNNTYGEPVNLGPKVNTEGKENFPSITADNKLYFSSKGRLGFGSYDVFVIDLAKGATAEAKNVGQPVNSGKDDFAFSFNDKKNIGFFSSNRDGFDKLYSAAPICAVEAIVTVRDADTKQPIAMAKVSILDDKNNVIETRQSAADGKVVYNVDCDRKYTVQVSADGYENNSWPVNPTKGGTVNIAADLKPLAPPPGPTVELSDIYFEFDKSNITKEGAFELDKLVALMQKYPEMKIMVKAHTDNRGSDRYNMALSNRRAKSTVQYVISKGISKDRISGQGYGESDPLIDCKGNCTEEEHAKNRRSEFYIVNKGGMGED